MRVLTGFAVAVVLLALGLAIFLTAPVLKVPAQRPFGEVMERQADMLRMVSADATDVVLIPSGGATVRRLLGTGALRAPSDLPPLFPWLIGGGDVVIWRSGSVSGVIARVDAPRRFLATLLGAVVREQFVLMGPEPAGQLDRPAIRSNLTGHLFVLLRESVGAVTIEQSIRIRTISPLDEDAEPRPLRHNPVRLPASAMVAAAFASTPAMIRKIEQTLPVEISPLLERGGVVALYQLHDERLLPRPRGVIVVPVTDQSFNALKNSLERLSPELPFQIAPESSREISGQTVIRRESLGFTLEYTRRGDELLIAFDKSSIEKYLMDTLRDFSTTHGDAEWLVRFDPQQLAPALSRVKDHAGLRLLLPELSRAVGDLHDAVQWVEPAAEVVAVKLVERSTERLEITISPPK